MGAWGIVKDILLTGTGVAVIILQMFSPHPSDALLAVALALTIPSIADHAKNILAPSAPGGSPSSPSSSPRGPSSSGSS